jgi:LmbE family N-acetylglucosaminyl deacetylase
MKLNQKNAFVWTPEGISEEEALARTTHLSIGAHPDDLEFMSYHGIASCYEKKDQFFTGIVVTDGAGSVKSGPYAAMTPQEMSQVRIQEQKKAAEMGKFNALIMLQYPSSQVQTMIPWQQRGWVQEIAGLMSKARPQILYSHNPFDKHPTHLAVILPLIRWVQTLSADQRPQKFYGCEVWRGLDWLLDPDRVELSFSGQEALAEKLNRLFPSQTDAGKNYPEAIRGRRIANATFKNPHSTDPATQLELAMDLTPLMEKKENEIFDYLKAYLDRFTEEVLQGIRKF